jgi:ribosomal protein L32
MKIHFMLLWNHSITTLVSCPTCGMLRLPTHHIVALCVQWSLRYSMNRNALGYLVAMMSICSCTHEIGSWSNGQAHEYIIWPKVDNTFVQSSIVGIFFRAFFAHVLHTCHKHKKTLAPGQTLLHGKTSSIEISSFSSPIMCWWMLSKHEIEHALMKT